MALTIIQYLILGLIQGVTEWLPISSSGMITLVMTNAFDITDIGFLIHSALFLHLGTFFAALFYFRNDVRHIFRTLRNYKFMDVASKKTFNFLLIATIISGLIGLLLLKTLYEYESQMEFTGKTITAAIAIFLLITAAIQLKVKHKGLRKEKDLNYHDGVVLGIMQGVSSLPGLSRSGMTISTLLLKKFDDTTALRLSFLLSLPIVLIGNIFLNISDFTQVVSLASLAGLVTAFGFGLLTIHGLMKVSKKINFGWFVLIFALLMLVSLLI